MESGGNLGGFRSEFDGFDPFREPPWEFKPYL